MLGITNYPAFLAAVIVFLALPGPGTFAVLGATARGGRRGGYAALFGLIVGDWCLMTLAMLGVAALMATHGPLFRAVQWLGAGYLAWVGLGLLRAGLPAHATLLPISGARTFRTAVLITLINPKAIVFYLGFFPLFIDPATYLGFLTLAVLALSISTLTLVYGTLLVFAGGWLASRLGRRQAGTRWLARGLGAALIGCSVRLAVQ